MEQTAVNRSHRGWIARAARSETSRRRPRVADPPSSSGNKKRGTGVVPDLGWERRVPDRGPTVLWWTATDSLDDE